MRIAVFTKNFTNPAYQAARLGADRAAAALGARVVHHVPERADDADQQSALLDRARVEGCDACVVSPVHPQRVDAALARMHAAGIPVVAFVNPVTAVPCVTTVLADDRALGRAVAEALFTRLQGRGRVLVVGGHAHSVTSRDRLQGFADAARARPGIELAGPCHGDYDQTVARAAAGAWLDARGAVDGCLVANDIMAIGVIEALEARALRSAVVGVNAIPQAIAAIRDGRMLASADFNAMRMAYLATECAIRHLRGETVPARIELPVEIVDAANCARWDLPYEERTVLTLSELAP